MVMVAVSSNTKNEVLEFLLKVCLWVWAVGKTGVLCVCSLQRIAKKAC